MNITCLWCNRPLLIGENGLIPHRHKPHERTARLSHGKSTSQFWIALRCRALWQLYCGVSLFIYEEDDQQTKYRANFLQHMADGLTVDPAGSSAPWWAPGLSL